MSLLVGGVERRRRASGPLGAATDALDGITPLPRLPELPKTESIEIAFRNWAQAAIEIWHHEFSMVRPGLPKFDLEQFDGCTFAPDVCRPCCLLHDLACYYGADRWVADRAFRDCIIAIGEHEDRFAGLWKIIGYGYWLGVRGFYRAKQLAQRREQRKSA